MKSGRAVALVIVIGAACAALVLPSRALSSLRARYHWIGVPLNRLEHLWPGVDLAHVSIFIVIALATGAWLGASTRSLLALGVLAAASELWQFWVPGRTPRLSDFALDVVGAVLGLLILGLFRRPAAGKRAFGSSKLDP